MLDLHRFFIAIARAVVNHDGRSGVAPDNWYGLQVLVLRDVARFVLFGIVLFCQGRLDSGNPTGLLSLLLLSVLMTLLFGPTLLVFWLNGIPFLVLRMGLLGVWILVSVVFPMWSCSFFMSFGLVRGCLWKRLSFGIFVLRAQFQCRLFLLVQALIFGGHVVLLVLN